jgi:hypothetical protein
MSLRCPYCHDDIGNGEATCRCPDCKTLQHSACVREHGRCVTFGCERPIRRARSEPVAARRSSEPYRSASEWSWFDGSLPSAFAYGVAEMCFYVVGEIFVGLLCRGL